MTTDQVQELERELSTCEGQIREIAALRPQYTLTQLRQGIRASRQDLETLTEYINSLELHREVSSRLLHSEQDSAFRPA